MWDIKKGFISVLSNKTEVVFRSTQGKKYNSYVSRKGGKFAYDNTSILHQSQAKDDTH